MSSDIFTEFPGYTGWIPDNVNDKDYQFVATWRAPWGVAENLRTNKDYKRFWIPVYDQGQTGSCTANAVAAAYSFGYNRYKNITANSENRFSPSRAFIYYNARKGDGETEEGDELTSDDGSAVRLALRSLQKWGVCQDVTWPLRVETVRWYPGPYAFFEAQKYMLRAYQYKRLDVKRGDEDRGKILADAENGPATMEKDGDTVLYNLRSCISQGNPVVFGFLMFWVTKTDAEGKRKRTLNWKQRRNDRRAKWELADVPSNRRHLGPTSNKYGEKGETDGHAVLAIGFEDDSNNKKGRGGWVLCQNSWGSSEQKGSGDDKETYDFFWMPYSYITDFTATMDFWMMDFSGFPSKL